MGFHEEKSEEGHRGTVAIGTAEIPTGGLISDQK